MRTVQKVKFNLHENLRSKEKFIFVSRKIIILGKFDISFFLCGHNTHVGHSIFTTFKGFYSDSFWRST